MNKMKLNWSLYEDGLTYGELEAKLDSWNDSAGEICLDYWKTAEKDDIR